MSALNPMSEDAFEFQFNFIKSGGVPCVLGMLTKNNFLPNADPPTKRAAYHNVLKICKLMLTTVGHALVHVVAEAFQPDNTAVSISPSTHSHAVVVQQALHHIPNVNAECMLRNVAMRLAQNLLDQATGHMPDMPTIRAVVKIAWASSTGATHLVHCSHEELHKLHEKASMIKPVNSEENQPESEDLQV